MTDIPSLEQLLDAVRMHLESLVIPAIRAEPKLYFQTLVAVNVLKLAQRELTHGKSLLDAEWESLNAFIGEPTPQPHDVPAASEALSGRNQSLIADIRAGKYDEPDVSVRLAQHLEGIVSGQLMINAPNLAQRLRIEDETDEHPA